MSVSVCQLNCWKYFVALNLVVKTHRSLKSKIEDFISTSSKILGLLIPSTFKYNGGDV